MRRIAILAASVRELAPARAGLRTIERRRRGHEVGWAGDVEVHLIKTGVGPAAAAEAAQAVLSSGALDAIVSTGYAGALGIAGPGEVILGTEVHDWTKERPRPVYRSDVALLAVAWEAVSSARTAWSQGVVVTVENVVWRAAEKQALGKVSGAIAVDMESVAIARAAASRNVPFLLVRAVSDGAHADLPMNFNLWFTPRGRLRGLVQVLMHPSIICSLLRMKRHVELGSQALAQFFRAFFVVIDKGRLPADALALATAGKR